MVIKKKTVAVANLIIVLLINATRIQPAADTAEGGRGASIIAAMTISFAANKVGYKLPGANHYTGQVVVGDIGVPRELVEEQAGPPASR
jgi:hypothetical protein